MDDDAQEACEAQAQNEERRRRTDEAVAQGQALMKQFRAEQIVFNDTQTAWFHKMGWRGR